jgi:protocatechuate 3,4-dioxygenase beta subunit
MFNTKRMWLLVVACVTSLCAQTSPASEFGKITVTMADSVTKQPITGAKISYHYIEGQRDSSQPSPTDEKGRSEFDNLQPGSYGLFWGRPPGYSLLPTEYGLISVKEGESISVPILLRKAGTIEGTVVDESGKPIADARLEAVDYNYVGNKPALRIQRTAFTDEKGRFAIKEVDPIGVAVRVSVAAPRANGQRFVTTFYPNSKSAAEASSITVPVGASVRGINFRLRLSPTFHIRGRIDQGQESPELATLTIQPCSAELSDTATAVQQVKFTSDGAFDIHEVLPGTYCLFFQRKDSSGREVRTFAQQTVTVVDQDADGIVLTPEQSQDVLVAIATENNTPLPPPRAILLGLGASGNLPPITARAIATMGGFRLPGVFPTDYYLQVYPALGTYIKSIKRGYNDLSSGAIQFAGDYGIIVLEMAAAQNRLRVHVNKDGHPAWKGIRVVAEPVDSVRRFDRIYSIYTNPQGDGDLSNMAPGTYNIFAFDEVEPAMSRPEFLQRLPHIAVKVTNGEDSTTEAKLITSAEIQEAKSKF